MSSAQRTSLTPYCNTGNDSQPIDPRLDKLDWSTVDYFGLAQDMAHLKAIKHLFNPI